ncbi:MAG: ABC transporter permease, partial [Bacteroidaceae bacterium]|nr:ABC transporter permease [Bacteroidaceae bacterium]
MKEFLKNLFAARGAAFWLNLLGLSLAFVIFYVLMAEVMWHVTFDRFHKDADRVCQVFYKDITPDEWEELAGYSKIEKKHFTTAFVEEICRSTQDFEASVIVANAYYYGLVPTDIEVVTDSIEIPAVEATEGLFEVFTFDFIEGGTTAISDPNNVFIPLSLAKKLFGETGPYVGRRCGERNKWEAYVGGVYRDFPSNTQLDNVIYRRFSHERWERNWDVNLFVKLREGVDGEKLSEQLLANSIMLRNESGHFTFLPIHDVYFADIDEKTHMGESFRRHGGNYAIVSLLALVALLVIIVAAINYTNFSMAMVPYQIKEINVRRVFGEKASNIRWRLMWQALLNITLALLLAYALLIIIIQNGLVDEWLKCDLALGNNGVVIGMIIVLAMLLPVVAGGYPAWYVTSRKPSLVINGNF